MKMDLTPAEQEYITTGLEMLELFYKRQGEENMVKFIGDINNKVNNR